MRRDARSDSRGDDGSRAVRWSDTSAEAQRTSDAPDRGATPATADAAEAPPAALPEGWEAVVDDDSGATYYRNSERHQSQWELPQVDAPADAPRPTAVV